MKHFFTLFIITGLLATITSCATVEDITQYAPVETYPADTLLQTLPVKKAMILIAHDDDMSIMSGTISQLNANGWEIRTISFRIAEERDRAHINASKQILDSVMFYSVTSEQIRFDLDTNRYPYRALDPKIFPEIFNKELFEEVATKEINDFQPSVIFSLDNKIGGYGHPDHVFVSQTVLDLAQSGAITPSYIYQGVYTDHMENTIMERHAQNMIKWGFPGDEWEHALKTYGVTGTPDPSVQIDIQDQAEQKMTYLRSFNERERKTMGFYIPAFEDYSAEDYFNVFNREFFRVIKIN